MRSYQMLSDHDFELLAADLLGAEDGVVYEAFARGADGGVDLRRVTAAGPDVVQCKHMAGSNWAQLKASAKAEATKLAVLSPTPTRYRFVTTQRLTRANKGGLKAILAPWISNEDDVLGADDLEGLLNRNPKVERAHLKLWLGSAAQLDATIHSATWERSRQLNDEIKAALPRYVENTAFADARDRLRAERVLVISGPPGIGKTTLARMLLADAAVDGYQPIEISSDINEANAIVNDYENRAFYYDDFLGSTFLEDRLAKNEDKRLTSFMNRCARGRNNLLVLTTREHILQQASSQYEALEAAELPLRRFLLELPAYNRLDRARIFYNHLWHSQQMTETMRKSLMHAKAYLRIIDHTYYNPRLIEYITGWTTHLDDDVERDYVAFALDALDNPNRIWERAFERQLDDDCRALLIATASCNTPIIIDDAQTAFESLQKARGEVSTNLRFKNALRVLDDSFLSSYEAANQTFITVANPSVLDFVASWLHENDDYAVKAVQGAAFFDQLTWLEKEVDGYRIAPHDFRDAVEAHYAARPVRWHEVHDWDTDQVDTVREGRDLEARLRFLQQLSEHHDDDQLRELFSQKLAEQAANWRQWLHPGHVLGLLQALHASDSPAPLPVIEAARDGLIRMNYSYAWSELLELRKLEPEAFPDDFLGEMTNKCQAWFDSELEDPDNISDSDDLTSMRHTAEEMGVRIDEDLYDSVEAELEARSREHPEPDDRATARFASSLSPEQESNAIDAMFSHLMNPS